MLLLYLQDISGFMSQAQSALVSIRKRQRCRGRGGPDYPIFDLQGSISVLDLQ